MVISILRCGNIYFMIEIILAMAAAPARFLLGLKLEPQFNDPLLSTSFQDFWSRWNIMATNVLHPAVYDPVLHFSTKLLGRRRWAPLPAVFAAFVVSGLMHELIFYYLSRLRPTGMVSAFFILHGGCLMVELCLKKVFKGRWQLPPLISTPLVVGFMMFTAIWLLIPQLIRGHVDVRVFEEYAALGAFVKDFGRALKIIV
ncbi:hypothetical protein L1049_010006 [Liquidambar formosana]|uniref:Wax synthase domain-containing protein n=1 Tax=Liquidambar formosana TaxID=63359 RepID=A0AAP0N7P9_LIQFO